MVTSAVIVDLSHYPVTSRGQMTLSRCPMSAASVHSNGYGYPLMVPGEREDIGKGTIYPEGLSTPSRRSQRPGGPVPARCHICKVRLQTSWLAEAACSF